MERAGLQLGALLLLMCLAFSRIDCVPLANSQAQVLLDCQREWNTTIEGWKIGGDCNNATSVTCDAQGMITDITLEYNSFSGTIPASIGKLTNLRTLDLLENGLSGPVPSTIGNLLALTSLILSQNSFSGSIPDSFINLTNLVFLSFWRNNMSGPIPTTIGKLPALTNLILNYNRFTGPIPDFISELTQLRSLAISGNQLTGSIPAILSNLRYLLNFDLGYNGFIGTIPDFISVLTDLQSLKLISNNLTGPIPEAISNLRLLNNFELSKNRFTGSIPDFISLLTGVTGLYFHTNQLTGPLPAGIGSLPLVKLSLHSNRLTGTIPDSVSKLTDLRSLLLDQNRLTGFIPPALSSLEFLTALRLNQNGFSGHIPSTIGRMRSLTEIGLSNNSLIGTIPSTIGRLTSLVSLYLANNSLSGTIPDSIGNLTTLSSIYLNKNNLTGSISATIGNLQQLIDLDLSANSLIGSIPSTIGRISSLAYLNLESNSLSGSMPQSFTQLTNLTELRLANNSLTGSIPESIGSLVQLSTLNLIGSGVSCPPDNTQCVVEQNLTSAFCRDCLSFCTTCVKPAAPPPAPSSVPSTTPPPTPTESPSPSSSSPASPSSPETPTSQSGGGLSAAAIAGIAVAAVAALVVLLLIGMLVWRRGNKKEAATSVKEGEDEVLQRDLEGLAGSVAASHCTEYSLEEVMAATSNWSDGNLLKSGTFGDVYKGVSPRDGTTLWAVKRAKLLVADFQREVRQMAGKNHPNIVRLLGFALGGDMRTRPEQVLIYEIVPNGDLEKWISTQAPFHLSLKQQLDILIGVARGFDYLHSFNLVHRDMKPANILLGADMQAKIADFGLVRVEEGTEVGTTRVMGTPGYVDPIYSRTSKATRATDVYSFGVLMLVVLTGRSPTSTADGENSHILAWVEACLASDSPTRLKDLGMEAPDDAVLRLAQLALSCTVERTASRPSMAGIANELQDIRNEVVGKEELSAAVKVDDQAQKMNGSSAIDVHLQCIDNLLEGNSFDDRPPT